MDKERDRYMNNKINKVIIVISGICTIIPFIVALRTNSSTTNHLIVYIPVLVGYMLYFTQHKHYCYREKILLYIAVGLSVINLLTEVLYTCYFDNIESTTSSQWFALLYIVLFYPTFFAHRVFSLILDIKVLKRKNSGPL